MLLGEPTCYSEVLQYAARDAARAGAEVEYTVILIITDGGVSDMEVSIVYTVYHPYCLLSAPGDQAGAGGAEPDLRTASDL